MRYMITGGAGFIGSHLCRSLLERGDWVYVLDNLSTGTMENIAELVGHPRFRFTNADVTQPQSVGGLVKKVDAVFHLAAAVGVQVVMDSPLSTIKTNLAGTEVVLEAVKHRKIPVFIASTSEVYGKSKKIPFREDQDLVMGATTMSRWSYACSKAMDEFMALAYQKEYGVPVVIARLFNTVGPRQTGRYGMVLPRFVRQALSGSSITVHGDGSQRRCFTHVTDVVSALMGLIESKSAYGRVFNVGSNEEISIGDLAERVCAAADSQSPIEVVPYAAAYCEGYEDMPRRVPDTTAIRELLGWRPSKDLDAILDDVIGFWRGSEAERPSGVVPVGERALARRSGQRVAS